MLLEFTKCVVTVTSAEQSFRKLKFIKTFITCNMANSRLSFFFPFVGIFIHLSQKAMGLYTSSLRSCRPSVYLPHLDGGISLSVFPNGTSKLDGFLNTIPLMLNVWLESCEYQFLSHWFDLTSDQTLSLFTPSGSEAHALSTRPSDWFFAGHVVNRKLMHPISRL